MLASDLIADHIYYLCTWQDMDCLVPKIEAVRFKASQASRSGEYIEYVFLYPGDAFQIEARAHLQKLGQGIADPAPTPRGELTMDYAGLEYLYDLEGIIEWLQELNTRLQS
jgi:hypothetical protein